MKEGDKEALKIVLDLAQVGLPVQLGLDDMLGNDFDIPQTFPIPQEEAEEALHTINEYLTSKVIANKS